MSNWATTCNGCNAIIRPEAGHAVSARLHWSASYWCDHCGHQLEVDGYGVAPAEIRAVLLERDGRWGLSGVASADRLRALKALREAFALPLADVGRLRPLLDGVFVHGTRAEIEWLRTWLDRAGAPCVAALLSEPPPEVLDAVALAPH